MVGRPGSRVIRCDSRSGTEAEQDEADHDQRRSPDLLTHQPLTEHQQAADQRDDRVRA
jgi:hypothetical protein